MLKTKEKVNVFRFITSLIIKTCGNKSLLAFFYLLNHSNRKAGSKRDIPTIKL